jgi:hypothetical protein
MIDIEARACAKPRREERYAPSPRLVASTSRLGREILDGVAKRPKLIEATCWAGTA